MTETQVYVNPWVRPVREDNPWNLPPMPEGYGRPRTRPGLRRANALLNLALACCVVFLTLVFPALLYRGLTGSNAVLGWHLVVITGDSMEPAIHAGALLLAKETPFSRLAEGDVIVYESCGKLNTHRIIALEYGVAITKGDAALLPDSVPVTPEMYRCKVRKVFNGFAWITRALTS